MTLREFFEEEIKAAQSIFERRGDLPLTFVGEDADGGRYPVMAMTRDDDDKDMAMLQIGEYFRSNNVIQYVVITEAWMLVLKGEGDPDKVPRPSMHPDRIETVVVMAYGRGNKGLAASMNIIREMGKPPRLAPPTITEGPSQGRWANMLGTLQ